MIDALIPFALAVAAFAIVGVGIGRLMAPRIERWTEPGPEDEAEAAPDGEPASTADPEPHPEPERPVDPLAKPDPDPPVDHEDAGDRTD